MITKILFLRFDQFYPNSFGDKASVADKAAQNAPQEKELATKEAKIEVIKANVMGKIQVIYE